MIIYANITGCYLRMEIVRVQAQVPTPSDTVYYDQTYHDVFVFLA